MTILGAYFATFGIVARCPSTGHLGIALASRAIAVGARCPHIRPGTGAVLTQAYTDPRLGRSVLDYLDAGRSPSAAIEAALQSDSHAAYRQIAVVPNGRGYPPAASTGSKTDSVRTHVIGPDFVALGNKLPNSRPIKAMADAFARHDGEALDERLLASLAAAEQAGGQIGGQRSSGILVYRSESFAYIDLRVDDHPTPIAELRRVHGEFSDVRDWYATRAFDPTDRADF